MPRGRLKGCFAPTKFASIYWRASRAGGRIIYFTSDAGIHGGAESPLPRQALHDDTLE